MLNRFDPKDARFLRLGRYDPSEDACALWWSGSGLRLSLACTRLEIEAEAPEGPHTPWLAVLADGAPVARFPMMPGRHCYALLSGMDGQTAHEVELLRDTQPTDQDRGPLKLLGVFTDGEPMPARPRPRLVEFIGDSLTVGEGMTGPREAQEWVMAWIANAYAFPERAARQLNADKRVIALGGWGAYKAWDGDGENRIGRIYDQLCGVVPGGEIPFDHAAQRPADAVVINLGTNDASAIEKAPAAQRAAERERLKESAVALMAQVRAAHPSAQIVWAYGLCGDAVLESLERAVALRRAAGDERTHFLRLTDCGDDLGSRSHPGRHAQGRAAREIAEYINSL